MFCPAPDSLWLIIDSDEIFIRKSPRQLQGIRTLAAADFQDDWITIFENIALPPTADIYRIFENIGKCLYFRSSF